MQHDKRDQQQPNQRDQRKVPNEQNRDLGSERNEEETGKPVQFDKDKEHQGNQPPRNPQTVPKPDQGQKTPQRM